MKFKYGSRRKAIDYENDIAIQWKDNKTFEESVNNRSIDNSFVFYDGPPFITGLPHHGTLLSSVVKDIIPRYQTMLGKRVERRWGWDCHGLPAENFVEKQLEIKDRREIGTKISLEEYVTKARESMVANSEVWESYIDRVGRWVDFKGAYRTMDKDFMESVWWAFKTLYDKGKIYEGKKVLMYDTKFATPVSKNEVTMDNDAYQTVTDPSVYVKFKLKDEETDLLVWTTTPWTLPANAALAVNPNLKYVKIELDDYNFIVAKNLIEKVFVDEKKQPLNYKIIDEFSGDKLVGRKYSPSFVDDESNLIFNYHGEKAHKIYAADYVEDEGGTGIVHVAPAYGEEDFELSKKYDLPVVDVLDEEGFYLSETAKQLEKIGVRPTHNDQIECWEANKYIAKCLQEKGIVWKIDYIRHEYPFNPRSKQRIMYRAFPSWFFDVQEQKPLMLDQNENINWFPNHIKHGRFAKNIDQAPDWNLSRDRFWATAMPVWKGDKGSVKVVGSYKELEDLSGKKLDDYHRPWVDEITFEIDNEKFERVDKVLDGWFESGSMPFAQFHYPFENKEKFEANYPGDFVVEYIAQVRAWFYYVHTVNTALFEEKAFKNVIVTGTLAGNDGRKMSKSLGNYTNPLELMDQYSADSYRLTMLSSPVLAGEDFALKDKDVSDTARKLNMIWNVFDFFTMYAEVDNFDSNDATLTNQLLMSSNSNVDEIYNEFSNKFDIWIISRLHQTAEHVAKYLDEYNIPEACSEISPFLDDLSNWYVRRSRRRFWKSEDDNDKLQAYQTLHYIMSYFALIIAPFCPFLAEELWQKLVGGESVHLKNWPKVGKIDQKVLNDMKLTRDIIEKGLALRMERDDGFGQIKIRQPLAELTYSGEKLADFYEKIIVDEVNVKNVEFGNKFKLDKNITPELKLEGQSREIIRAIQKARKDADLSVDDRININIHTEDEDLDKALELYKNEIMKEVLATEFVENDGYQTSTKIDGKEITIQLKKAK